MRLEATIKGRVLGPQAKAVERYARHEKKRRGKGSRVNRSVILREALAEFFKHPKRRRFLKREAGR